MNKQKKGTFEDFLDSFDPRDKLSREKRIEYERLFLKHGIVAGRLWWKTEPKLVEQRDRELKNQEGMFVKLHPEMPEVAARKLYRNLLIEERLPKKTKPLPPPIEPSSVWGRE